ncbi:MAG: beta-ketoacyl-ACP synthase II [Spirochaetaceae bacterium]|nr:beta-ketoacyl-ACP synthase II [Spirochaetaceae bacterium]
MGKRVVITGMGTVNPLGKNVADTWSKVLEKRSVIGKITRFDTSNLPCQIAAEIKDFDYKQYCTEDQLKIAKRMDPFCHYAIAAMKEAWESSGVKIDDPYRIGVMVGTGIGGLSTQFENSVALATKGPRRISPFYIPLSIGNIASGYLSMIYGLKGPNLSVQTACASANHAFITSSLMIKAGMADVMFAGATEATMTELALGGFANMHALSTRNDSPETASRPFDKDRDGFVMGEGSGILCLEDYEHAKKRGANIFCELLSTGLSADSYDLVAPDPEGNGAYASMKMAVEMGNIDVGKIDYINAHGTSTPVGDIAESKAILKLLTKGEDNVCIGSTKSIHGHLLGAAAAVEGIISIMAIKNGKIPANINLFNLDPEIKLKSINTDVVEKDIKIVLSNSFGFGGHNSSVIFGKI